MNENKRKLDLTDDCKTPLKKYGEEPYLIIQNHQEIFVVAISNGS